MQNFYCNKRFDISFEDFHKLIKLVLPTDYVSNESRGIYKKEYQPCNIIDIYHKYDINIAHSFIYCWLGRRGLTVLADTSLAASICLEVCKEIKQNAEDWKMLSYPLIDEDELINSLASKNLLLYKLLNTQNNTSKWIIKEYNNDECTLEFFKNPDSLRVSGAFTSLLSLVQISINKILNNSDKQE